MPLTCSLYRSHEPISNTSPTYLDYIRDAAVNGSERVYHYNTIPKSVKQIEPHIAFYSLAESEDAFPKPGHESSSAPEAAKNTSRFDDSSGLPVTTNENNEIPQSCPFPTALDQIPKYLPPTSTPEWASPPSDIPLGRAEDTISWTDDDVDATDYKNMPDYDPDQDDSVYDSTTDSDAEATASPPKKRSQIHSVYIKLDINLFDGKTNSASEVLGVALPISQNLL